MAQNSGGLSETQASGNREYMRKVVQNMKDRLGHDESVSENIDGLLEDAHFDMDAIYGFINAGGIAHGPELRKRILKYSRNLNCENIKVCSVSRE